jgi:rhodanese-related sulfurtransferase
VTLPIREPDRRATVDDLVAEARATYERVTPGQAFLRMQSGAVLVDTRSPDQQRRQGFVSGAVRHPLSALLWRLDPDCPTSNEAIPLDAEVILICREGYSSSFAAAQLRAIGFARATDVIGGVEAWKAAGLPVSVSRLTPAVAPSSRHGVERRIDCVIE